MKHLENERISAVVAGLELEAEERAHLESCVECRRSVSAMRDLISVRRVQLEAGEPDWSAQREAVLGRLPPAGRTGPARGRGWWRPALAAAAAVIVAGVVILMGPRSSELASNGPEIPVAEILAEVDALLEDDSIPGFEVIDPGVDGLEGVIANGSS
jgi:hypothetical protein